jgi:pimeloyl-ACP methyl ester carboxylesterase
MTEIRIRTRTVDLGPGRSVAITITEAGPESGAGHAALVLHGGGGPVTVQSIAEHLSGTMHVVIPVHPGWNGTPRPGWLSTVSDLAAVYLRLLEDEGLRDVLVIGSSMGGWIGADMAAREDGHIITGLVLIDSVGVLVEGQPIRDFFALDARGVAEYSYHDPDRFYVDPATVPPEQAAQRAANMATMRVFAGDPYMHDPGLAGRLGRVGVPVLALWGDSDRIVTPGYGQALAAMFPRAQFVILSEAGHLPQIEQPAATLGALDAFIRKNVSGLAYRRAARARPGLCPPTRLG